MNSLPVVNAHTLYLIAPVLIFTTLAFISLAWGAVSPRAAARGSVWLGLIGAAAALGITVDQFASLNGSELLFSGMIAADRFSLFFSGLTSLIVFLVLLLGYNHYEKEEIHVGELYVLIFFAAVGIILLAMSNDLMTLFIAVELMSISAYALTGFNRGEFPNIEASLKYFILGAFGSGLLLYGIALTYGATGLTQLSEMGNLFSGVSTLDGALAKLTAPELTPEVLPYGIGLLVIGLAFKVGAAPFHMWVPDVYQGAPAPITAFMSTAIKAAALAAFSRLLVTAFPGLAEIWGPIIMVLAILTMIVGNLAAVVQDDVKRMLAYSSIAHGGYALTGLLALSDGKGLEAVSAILVYMLAYAVMNIGAFAVITHLQKKGEVEVTRIEDFNGLGFKYPALGMAMTLFLISLGGLPPTAGFIGKFNLFSSVVASGHVGVVLLALATSMASMYYYIRVVVAMYMKEATGEVETSGSWMPVAVITLTAAAVVIIGLFPSSAPFHVLEWARASVQSILA